MSREYSAGGTITADAGEGRQNESPQATTVASPHSIEHEVQRRLLAAPNLNFSSLVVRRVENGVCLEGVLETGSRAAEAEELARQISSVQRVLNHLVVRHPLRRIPAKG